LKSEAGSSPNARRTPLDWSRLKRVLLVRLRSIGDTVLMTPCLQALKDFQPDVEIGVITEPIAAPILEGHTLVDHLFVTSRTLGARLGLMARLRRMGFDVAFNLHGGSTAMFLTAASGAQYTVGFRDQRGSWLVSERAPAPQSILGRNTIHSVEQQLALLSFAGVPLPERPRLSLPASPEAAARARTRLIEAGVPIATIASSRFVIVAPGAAFESKRWGVREFAAVIDHLNSRWQLASIIIAGPEQGPLASEVSALADSKPRVLSRISLAELIAIVGNFGRLFLGNDSGPMHIAAALCCPIVAVFGSSNPDVWHPWTSAAYRVIGGRQATADSNVRGSIDTVSIDEVTAAVDDVIQATATCAAS
jgi:lipopolysaccharide heptosyltransferase III